jgi:hypothetical protein
MMFVTATDVPHATFCEGCLAGRTYRRRIRLGQTRAADGSTVRLTAIGNLSRHRGKTRTGSTSGAGEPVNHLQ